MSKKYQPSGYQIINVDMTGKTSGTAFTPETEDEKLLYDILRGKVKKPILLQLMTSETEIMGFVVVVGGNTLFITSDEYSETFYANSSGLVWVETEL